LGENKGARRTGDVVSAASGIEHRLDRLLPHPLSETFPAGGIDDAVKTFFRSLDACVRENGTSVMTWRGNKRNTDLPMRASQPRDTSARLSLAQFRHSIHLHLRQLVLRLQSSHGCCRRDPSGPKVSEASSPCPSRAAQARRQRSRVTVSTCCFEKKRSSEQRGG
jgi:hypothetical protein